MIELAALIGGVAGSLAGCAQHVQTDAERLAQARAMQSATGIYDVARGSPTPSTWKCSWCGGANDPKHHWCPGCGAAAGT